MSKCPACRPFITGDETIAIKQGKYIILFPNVVSGSFLQLTKGMQWIEDNIIGTSLYRSKKENKDQESIQLSTTPDPGYQWESDNVTIRHHKREPRGQPFPSR